MKTKIDIVLELVRQGKVTNEEAKILLTTERIVEKEYIYYPNAAPIWPANPLWPTITYGTLSSSSPNEAAFSFVN